MQTQYKEPVGTCLDDSDNGLFELVVHKGVRFDMSHYIRVLVYACDHGIDQAEQCAVLIDFKGCYAVKTGCFDDIAEMRDVIFSYDIETTIKKV